MVGKTVLLYHYDPSLAAAVTAIALFAITTFLHVFQIVKNRTWYFAPFVIGGFFEWIGYIGRAIASQQTPDWTLGPYIMQTLLLLLAPNLFAASIYMILSRIITLTDGEHHSPIRANWLTKIFVTGDVISFLAQAAGGSMLANAKTVSAHNLGQNVITGGLGIQLLFFGVFMIVAATFHRRISSVPTTRSRSLDVPWQRYLCILYIASACILIRSVFRIVEYVMGQSGVLLSHETFLYIFDGVPMFLAMIVFNIWHPSQIINKKHSQRVLSLESGDGHGVPLHAYQESSKPRY